MTWPKQPCPVCRRLVAVSYKKDTPKGHGWVHVHGRVWSGGDCPGSGEYVLIQERAS